MNLMGLTPQERALYSPFHLYPEFTEGHDDHVLGNTHRRIRYSQFSQYVYDLGVDFAKRRSTNGR
jgi:hypothetical protein